MAKQTTANAGTKARALELARKMSLRDVAARLKSEGFQVSHMTVARWVAEARSAGGAAADGAARPRPGPSRSDQVLAHQAERAADEVAGVQSVADLERMAEVLKARIGELERDAEADRVLVRMMEAYVKLVATIAKLRPPPRVDPETDPLSIAAKDAALAKVRMLVSRAKARTAA